MCPILRSGMLSKDAGVGPINRRSKSRMTSVSIFPSLVGAVRPEADSVPMAPAPDLYQHL